MTSIEFRKNWWSHVCSDGEEKWTHIQYKHCDKCGYRHGFYTVTKGHTTL